jgi:galacturonosyltransferase
VVSTITGLGEAFLHDGLKSRLIKGLCKRSFKTAACIVFQNREDEAILRQGGIVTRQKTLHVPGSGVNLQAHRLLPYPPDTTISFLYVGRIMKAKGILQLIQATRRLQAEMPDTFTVSLMGFSEGDVQQELEAAEKESLVINLGFKKDIVPFIQQAHCIVLPSYYKEGLNNSLLEAAANGRPLITTDISGCRETVDDGVNGFICQPRDAAGLYDCMKRFIQLPHAQKQAMGIASREKAERQFDRSIVVDTMLNVIYVPAPPHPSTPLP